MRFGAGNRDCEVNMQTLQKELPLVGERVFVRGMQHHEWHQYWRDFVPDAIAEPYPYRYNERQCDKMFEHAVERASWYPALGVFLKETGEPIGIVQLKRVIPKKHQDGFPTGYKFGAAQCELGLTLQNDSRKNKGYGSEAVGLIFPYAFERYDLERIYADTFGTNKRMQHLLPKWGFRYISTYTKHFKLPIGRVDRLNYVLVQKWYNMRFRDYRPVAFFIALYINLRLWAYLKFKEGRKTPPRTPAKEDKA